MQPIIVGIDPGTTSAFAAISFDFKLIKIKSRKEYSLAGLISDIYKAGNPILVGTDKKEVPSFIKEFSQKTGAKIYTPNYDTKKDEKKYIVKHSSFAELAKNAHEIDALASALYAYNEYSQLIKKIDAYCKKNDKEPIKGKLIIKVITEDKSISDAVFEIEKKPVKKETAVQKIEKILKKQELTPEQKELFFLKENNQNLKETISQLREENRLLKEKKFDIGSKAKSLLSFKENKAMSFEKENSRLKNDIFVKDNLVKKLDDFIAKSSTSVILKHLKNLGTEEYNQKKETLKISKGDILFVDDISIISENVLDEIKSKVKIIISREDSSKGDLKNDFTLINKHNLSFISETKYFSLVKKEDIERQIELSKKQDKKSSDYLKDILEEYKRKRF